MLEQLANHWSAVHFTSVFTLLALLMLGEMLVPRNELRHPLRRRWFVNGAVLVIDQLLLRLLTPMLVALIVARGNSGLFAWVEVPLPVMLITTVIALDFSLFAFHRLAHHWPILWRIHRLHHSDPDVDVTTGWRFHPLEALLQALTLSTMILLLGAPAAVVALYLLVQGMISMLSHTNLRLPARLDRALRWIMITPDMHRIHHSTNVADYQSNFSIGLSIWDRLSGSYRSQPEAGHDAISFGIPGLEPARQLRLGAMLADPFLAESVTGQRTRPDRDHHAPIGTYPTHQSSTGEVR